MTITQKNKKIQLNFDGIEDTILLGIVSAEPDYKLSLAINKRFRISLKSSASVKIPDITGNEVTFSRFSYTSSAAEISYILTSNRSEKSFLLKKLRNIDYIFHVCNPPQGTDNKFFITAFREIEHVNAVFNIDINIFRDKNLQYLIH